MDVEVVLAAGKADLSADPRLDFESTLSPTVAFMTAATERLLELVDSRDAPDLPPLSAELVRTLDLPEDLPAELAIGDVAEATGVSAHLALLRADRAGRGRS